MNILIHSNFDQYCAEILTKFGIDYSNPQFYPGRIVKKDMLYTVTILKITRRTMGAYRKTERGRRILRKVNLPSVRLCVERLTIFYKYQFSRIFVRRRGVYKLSKVESSCYVGGRKSSGEGEGKEIEGEEKGKTRQGKRRKREVKIKLKNGRVGKDIKLVAVWTIVMHF